MDPSNSTEQMDKSLSFNQKLLIGGAIAAVLATILGIFGYISWRQPRGETTPPPIIVKSGSFIFETEGDLVLTNPGAPPNPGTPPNPCRNSTGPPVKCVYKQTAFTIRLIRLSVFNEKTGFATGYPVRDARRVGIFFQEYRSGHWTDPNDAADVIIEQDGADLKLTWDSETPLNRRENHRPQRLWKFENADRPGVFRIGKIQIDDSIPTKLEDWEELTIGIYKQ